MSYMPLSDQDVAFPIVLADDQVPECYSPAWRADLFEAARALRVLR